MKKVLLAAIAALALFALPSVAGAYPSSPPAFNSSNDSCFDSATNVARPLACDTNGNQGVNIQNTPSVTVSNSGDPCANPNVAKKSFFATITTATTTEAVAGVSAQVVHLCSLTVQTVGTSPTWSLKIGTKTTTACDTSGSVVSPAFGGATNQFFQLGYGGEVLNTSAVANSELCVVSAGTITDIFVFGTYVQQ